MNIVMAIAWGLVGAANIWFFIESHRWGKLIVGVLCFVLVVLNIIREYKEKKESNG